MREIESTARDQKRRNAQAIFMGMVGVASMLYGFSHSLAKVRKTEEKFLKKNLHKAKLLDEGSTLAVKALGIGSLYAVLGTATVCFGIWKLSGASNMDELRMKFGNFLPKLSKDGGAANSRTEFDSLTDLMEYLSIWGRK